MTGLIQKDNINEGVASYLSDSTPKKSYLNKIAFEISSFFGNFPYKIICAQYFSENIFKNLLKKVYFCL